MHGGIQGPKQGGSSTALDELDDGLAVVFRRGVLTERSDVRMALGYDVGIGAEAGAICCLDGDRTPWAGRPWVGLDAMRTQKVR